MQERAASPTTVQEQHVVLFLDLATENPISEREVLDCVPPGELVLIYRASELGAPRSPRGTPESWPAVTYALDQLVARARETEQSNLPCRYWIAGRAGLPAFFYMGYLLTKHARVTLVNPRNAGPLDVLELDRHVDGAPATGAYFDQIDVPPREIGGPVPASLAVSAGIEISRSQLTRLLPGAATFTAHAEAWLDADNVGHAIRQLSAIARAIQTKVPERAAMTVLVAGPATLAFLVGRALSPNIYPDLDVFQHRDHKYELAFEIRRSRSLEIQTVLFVSGDTTETRGLTLGREHEEISLALRASVHRDLFELVPVLAARRHDLPARMRRHKPQVVHFCGHGSIEGVALRDDGGSERLTSPQALAAILGEVDEPVRLVVLNICHGADQVNEVVAHAHCCIAMAGSIRDGQARRFAKALYGALGDGQSVMDAFHGACTAAELAGPTPRHRDADLSSLFATAEAEPFAICVHREGVDPAQLVLVRARL